MFWATIEHLCDCWAPITAFVFLLAVLAFLLYMGLLQPVYFVRVRTEPMWLYGKRHRGAYKNIGPLMDELGNLSKKHGLDKTCQFAGMYFDEPGKVPDKDLRAFAAIVLPEKAPKELLVAFEEEGLEERAVPSVPCHTSTFPLRNVLSFMCMMKVYNSYASNPELMAQCEYDPQRSDVDAAVIELYTDRFIQHIFPLQTNPAFRPFPRE